MAQSGKGGTHAYYLAPPSGQVRNAQALLGGHMDVRGVDGYIVAPPSIHPESGRPYMWIEMSRTQILPLPPGLIRYLLTEQPVRRQKPAGVHRVFGGSSAGGVGPEQRFTHDRPCPI